MGWLRLLLAAALACLIHALPAAAAPRSYFFASIGSAQGLAQDTVHVLFQDRRGFIWIGTEGALHRYDGYTLTAFEHDPAREDSLPDSLVTAMADAPDGKLWIGLRNGALLRFDPLHDKVAARIALPQQGVDELFTDAQGRLWIGQQGGVTVLAPPYTQAQTIHAAAEAGAAAPQPHIVAFAQCPDGSIFAASRHGLLALGIPPASRLLGPATPLTGVLCGPHNQLFVSDAAGVQQVDLRTGKRRSLWSAEELPQGRPGELALDHDGRLWLALRGVGLLRLGTDGKSVRLIRAGGDLPHALSRSDITHLLVDRSGLLWVGTHGSLFHVQPEGSPFQLLRDSKAAADPVAANDVRALFRDSDQRLWIGSDGAGLRHYDPASETFGDDSGPLRKALELEPEQSLIVYAIAPAAAGALWLGSNHGALYYDPATQRARPIELGESGSRVRSIYSDSDGSVWFGTSAGDLLHYRAGVGVIHRYTTADGLADGAVFALARDASHRLWVGTLGGLSLLDPVTQRLRSFAEQPGRHDSLAGTRVLSLYPATDGSLWVGTTAGLNQLLSVDQQGAHFRRFLRADGLPDQTVYCVEGDAQGRLWVSTNLGIARIDPAGGANRSFTLRDGLQGLEFNAGTCVKDADGTLWFGGTLGINSVHPGSLAASDFQPPVAITGVQFGAGREQPALALPAMPQATQSSVRFHFAALDYAVPQENRFQYRLIGVDHHWVDAGEDHSASYANLGAGHYRFEVRGSNHDGRFNPVPARFDFRILPPWWAAPPVKLGAAAAGLLVLAMLVLLTLRRLRTMRLHREELQQRDTRLRMALFGSGGQFWDWDMRDDTLHRIGADQLVGGASDASMSISDWRRASLHPDDLPRVQKVAEDYLAGRTELFESEHRIRTASGDWIWVHSRGKIAERDADGTPLRICGTAHDITAKRIAESDRRIASAVIRSMTEAVTVTDLDFRFVSVNPAFTRMTGYRESEVIGRDASLLDCGQHSSQAYRQIRQSVRDSGHWSGELWQRRSDGVEILCRMELNEVWDADGQRSHFVSVLTDITERKRSERELRYLASYDALTGLPNRTLLSERLGEAIAQARRDDNKIAVLFIDLDRFKQVNDSMGHAAGDRMLKAAGARLRASVRDGDTVARFGGDEFAVVLADLRDAAEADMVAHLIIEAFTVPLQLDGSQEVSISPSIGMALYPDHSQSAVDLLKFADTAMYQAKECGRNTWAVYTKAMDANARYHATLLTALRRALENNELRLAYQPKLELDSGRITGVEALLRWTSPSLGSIPPAVFIPLAEEAGLIVEIGEFVLGRACATLAQWQRNGMLEVSVAVNISSAQLLGRSLLDHLRSVLDSNGLAASSLELELTESLVMADAEASLVTLGKMRSIGVRLAVDDFGTGYSSLAYLKRLPIDTLKIDKAFIQDLTRDADDEAITTSIINMAHTLGINVIAEGVETQEQLDYLREKDCDEIQGNLLSVPLPADACLAFLHQHQASHANRLAQADDGVPCSMLDETSGL
ncbi:MAG TPA: EAL domain-containing protein [Rhodanobacteraceae bacterium]|nr:EAL domain-containing protein [Rhodanobacteraceae bacterium]